jgi:hypothetical protein
MIRRIALTLLALAAPVTLLGFLAGGAWGPWAAAVGGAVLPVALIALGAARPAGPGGVGALGWGLLALWILLAGGLAALLLLPDGGPGVFGGLGGLPLGTALLIFGLVPGSFALVVTLYAATFDRHGLRPEDLERIRRLRPSRPAAGEEP